MKKDLIAASIALVAIAAAFGIGATIAVLPQQAAQTAAVAEATGRKVSIDDNTIIGKAAILYDPADGTVLYQKDAQEQLPLASLTKLMTSEAVLASRDPSTKVTFTAADLAPDGDWGFRVGDTTTIGDLLRFGLVVSSNDALAAAASSLGSTYLDAMNAIAQRLNLTRTYFLNPTGLDMNDSTAGAYGSAFDVARLTAGFYKDYPSLFEQTTRAAASIVVTDQAGNTRTLSADATSKPLDNMPGFVGGKTGYTDLAGGNLTAVFDVAPNHPIVAVVLHSTEQGRYADIRTLIDTARLVLNQ